MSMNLTHQAKKLGYVAGIAASVSIGSLVISPQQAQALNFLLVAPPTTTEILRVMISVH
ncbi:hypothetical protein [Trichormus azollae]|nr:hypothetical protein [Trichormus azollae]